MTQFVKFTVIIAVLNARGTLERCLESILSQEYPHKSILLVDGGSADGTLEIIRKYQEHLSWWVSEPDRGIYDAWNKALAHVGNSWVLFLGADDKLTAPNVLSTAAKKLERAREDIEIAYGRVAVVDNNDHILMTKGVQWSVAGKDFTSIMTLPHQGVFHRSSAFKHFGSFNPAFKIAGDYDFLLRILPGNEPFYLGDLVVASWQVGGISYDAKTALRVAKEFSLARRMNGIENITMTLAVFYLKAVVLWLMCLVLGDSFANRFAETYRKLVQR